MFTSFAEKLDTSYTAEIFLKRTVSEEVRENHSRNYTEKLGEILVFQGVIDVWQGTK